MTPPSTLDLYRDVWQAKRDGAAGLAARQKARLNAIVQYARQYSPLYAELYKDLPETIDSPGQLPIVSKAELMPRFTEWVTDPEIDRASLDSFIANPEMIGRAYLGKYTVCTTSGTTGQPAVLLQDAATMNLMGALNILRAMPAWIDFGQLMKIIGAGMKTGAVWAVGGHYLGITMMRRQILQKPARARAMRVFPVLSPLAETVAGLNQFQPAMLNGYATAISLLAQEQEAGRLNIHPVLVMTSSESLSQEERERIKRSFNCTVADNYGCSEFVAIASGCKHGWLHVNADWVILEPVDEQLQPVPPGVTSHTVLLTNLINHVQPILRYNLGDRITVRADACPCGSPFPAIRVEGRTDEILRMRAADGQAVPILPLALWATIKQVHGVQRFQVIQTSPAELKIRMEPVVESERGEVWEAVQAQVKQYLAVQGLPDAQLLLANEAPLRDPKSGKYRHVWSEDKKNLS